MDFPIWMNPFSFYGVKGEIFHFYFNLDENNLSKQKAPDGTPRYAASHLWLFRLSVSHKKGVRLIWVNASYCFRRNIFIIYFYVSFWIP